MDATSSTSGVTVEPSGDEDGVNLGLLIPLCLFGLIVVIVFICFIYHTLRLGSTGIQGFFISAWAEKQVRTFGETSSAFGFCCQDACAQHFKRKKRNPGIVLTAVAPSPTLLSANSGTTLKHSGRLRAFVWSRIWTLITEVHSWKEVTENVYPLSRSSTQWSSLLQASVMRVGRTEDVLPRQRDH